MPVVSQTELVAEDDPLLPLLSQVPVAPSSPALHLVESDSKRQQKPSTLFVSRILSMINLPRESVTATEIVAWWTSMPIYFSWLITALLSVSGDANNHNLPQSGRLLYCVQHYAATGGIPEELLIRPARCNPI